MGDEIFGVLGQANWGTIQLPEEISKLRVEQLVQDWMIMHAQALANALKIPATYLRRPLIRGQIGFYSRPVDSAASVMVMMGRS